MQTILNRLQSPCQVGSLSLTNRVLLAPLAGVSDPPFRRICTEHGAGLTFVEMISANAVTHQNPRTEGLLQRHPEEQILGVQLSGPTVETVAEAVGRVVAQHRFELIDLNMGCPVKKIVGKGYGSALLRMPERIFPMVEAAVQASTVPVSVKIRLGFTHDTVNVREVSAAIAEAGAVMLTIHGRTRQDNYGIPVQFEGIAEGLEEARRLRPEIIGIGNGDILDEDSGVRMMEETAADGIMISRGALGDPWIFSALTGRGPRRVTPKEWLVTVLRHIDYHEAHHKQRDTAPMLFRKHLLWYITGFPGARRVRDRMATSPSFEHMRRECTDFAHGMKASILRFGDHPGRNAGGFDPKYDMDRKLDRSS